MKRALVFIALAGCFPFEDALRQCHANGRCGDGGADAGTDAGPAYVAKGHCAPNGMCWEHPLPLGSTLNSVWMRSPDDWWAVGERGAVLHFTGNDLVVDPPVTNNDGYWRVWGTSAGDVFVTGNGSSGLWHHTSSGWSSVSVGNVSTVASGVLTGNEAANTLWLIDQAGISTGPVSGDPFTTSSAPLFSLPEAACGATATQAYVVTFDAPFLYSASPQALTPIEGFDAGQAFGCLAHSNGSVWVSGIGSDGNVVGRWNNTTWDSVSFDCRDGVEARALAEVEDGGVLILCDNARVGIAAPNGFTASVDRDAREFEGELRSLSAVGPNAVAVGVGQIVTRTGHLNWHTLVSTDARAIRRAAFANGAAAVVGDNSLVMVRDGGEWLAMPPLPDTLDTQGVAYLNGALVVAGLSDVFKWADGWTPVGCMAPAGDSVADLAVAGGDLWVLTRLGEIFHQPPGAACVDEMTTASTLVRIAAAPGPRVFAVGADGGVWTRDLPDGGWELKPVDGDDFVDVALSSGHAWGLTRNGALKRLPPDGPLTLMRNADCSNALTVYTGADGGDVLISVGAVNTNSQDPVLCLTRQDGTGLSVPVASDLNATAVTVEGKRAWVFGYASSMLSWPIP